MIPLVQTPSGVVSILTPNPIKKICLTLILATLFILAIVKLSPEAEGQWLSYDNYPSGFVSSTAIDHQKPRIAPRRSTSLAVLTSPYQANIDLGQQIASTQGIVGKEWECLNTLWGKRESGWDNTILNKGGSGAFGIAQFLDSTWKGTGYQRSLDPEIQIRAGLVYIKNRYKTPCVGLKHSYEFNWY